MFWKAEHVTEKEGPRKVARKSKRAYVIFGNIDCLPQSTTTKNELTQTDWLGFKTRLKRT